MMPDEVVKEWVDKANEDFGFASTCIEHTNTYSDKFDNST